MNEPDFAQLARETLWGEQAWRAAWDRVSDHPELWEHVLSVVKAGFGGPFRAAELLRSAYLEPTKPIGRIS